MSMKHIESVHNYVKLIEKSLDGPYFQERGTSTHVKLEKTTRGTIPSFKIIYVAMGVEYTYSLVDAHTGNIYRPSGKLPIGNVTTPFKGMETIGTTGLLNRKKCAEKYAQLITLKQMIDMVN